VYHPNEKVESTQVKEYLCKRPCRKTDQNQNQGPVSAERGAATPALLAALPPDTFRTGAFWYEEKEIRW